jgi:outer membrane receptor protein involved in Fe transport
MNSVLRPYGSIGATNRSGKESGDKSPHSKAPGRVFFQLVLVLMLSALAGFAQDSGTVSGVVVNAYDGAALAGATVTVRGTTLAAQTDNTGRFELKNLPTGDQVLRISKSGFAAAVITDVRVLPGQTTTVNGNLRPEFYEMEEYEVTAEEFTQQTEQILIERQQSSGMLDALGSEQFSKLGAGDAAEALSKVSGASIADGKFAVIRGLADRYTTTTLNGTDLPSADPDRKAAQLDLLPTQVIERMDVSKTFSPDMGGGFAGGAINIITKSYPEEGMFSFSLGTSYNTQASLNEQFLITDHGGRDWLAMDDGTRELPAVARGASPAGSSDILPNDVERSFGSQQLSGLPDKSPLNSSMALTFGDSLKRGDFKLGMLGSLNYKNEYKYYDNGIVRKYEKNIDELLAVRDKTDVKGVIEYTWAAAAALAMGWQEDHELKFNYLYVQAAEDEARRLQGTDGDFAQPPSYLDQNVLHWTERNLTYYQLVGSHDFPEWNDVAFDWAGAYSTATQDEPDYRIFQFLATPEYSDYLPQASTEPSFPTRYWRELDEKNTSLRGDLTIPLPSYNSKDNFFKPGVAFSDSQRDYYQRGFSMVGNSRRHPFNTTGDPQSYLDPTNAAYIDYYNFPANLTYEGSQEVQAAYAMVDWAAVEWLRLVGGARIERTDLQISGFNQTLRQPIPSGSIERDDWLPSIAATFSLREDLQLRAAWSQTVVRPAYREIAAVPIYDIGQSRVYIGNPALTFSESANYDLRLEWYPRPGEIVSLSGFMKKISAPIEQYVLGDQVTYENFETADVFGVEVEYRAGLDRLWRPLEELTLGLNGAYIYSEVPLTALQQSERNTYFGDTDTSRPLYDQPEFVFNADLTWDHRRTGTTFTIAAGVVGRRLVVVGMNRPDEYEEPAPQLDFFLSQKLGKHWKVKFSAKNLLDPTYEVTQTWPQYGSVVLKSYTKGMTFGLSLGCEF